MNPNSQNQQQPVPGMSPAAAVPQQNQSIPDYANDPRSLLVASGNAPQPVPQSMPMPVPGQPAPVPNGYQQPNNVATGQPVAQPTIIAQATVGQGPANPGTPAPAAKPVSNPNSTQNMLQIAEIRDGIVIMNDGSFRSVVMVNSINFDLMSRSEQEAVEFNYQNFLNSLYFEVQIFIRSQKVDMGPYIEKLDKIRSEHDNMLLALLMDDYTAYIEALSQQTNIMDKKFYIVVPYFPHVEIQKAFTQSKNFLGGIASLFSKQEQHIVINEEDLEKAKSELRNRVQTVLDGLLQCGIQSLPLDTEELIELFYDAYNPDTATRQQLKNFGDMSADVVTKGMGAAPQPHLERELH